jgi:phage replication initiation protein
MVEKNDFDVLLPYSNRVVENTEGAPLIAVVDWLSVTFKSLVFPDKLIHLLGLKDCPFVPFDSGKYGYTNHLRFGHIGIYYSENNDDIFLDISGQGCREFEQNSIYDWSTFFQLILMLPVKITRLDLAVDDRKGYFTFAKLKKKIKQCIAPDGHTYNHVRSQFREVRILEKFKLSNGEELGTTMYFGSPTSLIQIRIYDKLQQLISKKKTEKEREELKKELGDFWIRTEMQLRDERATLAVVMIAERDEKNLATQVLGHIRKYLLFVDDNGDKNKSRWPISPWWLKFLNDVEALPLTMVAPDVSVEKAFNWLLRSCSASFDLVLAACDYDLDFVLKMVIEGNMNQKKKHENMLIAFKGKNYNADEIITKRNEMLIEMINIKKDQNQKGNGSDHD